MKKLRLFATMLLSALSVGAQNVTAELGSGSDLNTYTSVGWFLQYDGNIGKNYPPERSGGILLVTGENSTPTGWAQGLRYQTYQTTGGHAYVRTLYNYGRSWTDWNQLTTTDVLTAAVQAVGNLPSNGDLNTFNTPGRYCEWDNNNFAGSANFPEPVSGLLTVTTSPGAAINSIQDRRYQTYQTASGHVYARSFLPTAMGGSGWAAVWSQLSGTAASKWLASGPDIYYPTGKVGIGTSSPLALLHVNGNVLVGTPTATDVYNVPTDYLLDVKGKVRAEKLTVNMSGADFVFAPSYVLEPLAKVSAFVKLNHRLPGIAPATTMQREGVEMGQQQTKLLQKVEELFLYAIAQDRLIAEQAKLLLLLQKRLDGPEQRAERP